MVDVNNVLGTLDLGQITLGNEFCLGEEMRLRIFALTDKNGKRWLPFFTNEEEVNHEQTTSLILNMPIRMLVEDGYECNTLEGIVINPFSDNILLGKEILGIVMKKIGEA